MNKMTNANNKIFMICGYHTVVSAIKNKKRKIYNLFLSEKFYNDPFFKGKGNLKNNKFFDKVFGKNYPHQGIAAQIEELKQPILKEEIIKKKINRFVILDGISDPRNIGSIYRTCLAFDFKYIIINQRDFNTSSYELYKSASGSVENLYIFKTSNISNAIHILKKNNFWIYGFDSNSILTIDNLKINTNIAYVFGSEGFGLKKITKQNCDEIIKIKIYNIDSLNVSNAVSSALAIHNCLYKN